MPARRSISGPDFSHEHAWWSAGHSLVAGVDEVGRGALAGPLVAAAVILPIEDPNAWHGLTDSKLLTHEQRIRWSEEIKARAVCWSVGVVECDELDALGLGPANRMAMERAVFDLASAPEAVLIDAMVTELPLPQVGIIDGDAISLSIAAASILAKATRDLFMIGISDTHPVYGFGVHKGYGTAQHLKALREHGPCAIHRRCFAPVASVAAGQ